MILWGYAERPAVTSGRRPGEYLIKAWDRAVAETRRKNEKETFDKDKIDGLEFLDVEKDGEG